MAKAKKPTKKVISLNEVSRKYKESSKEVVKTIEIDGEEFTYILKTHPTSIDKAELLSDLRSVTLFLYNNEEYLGLPEAKQLELYKAFALLSAIKVFTDVEIPVAFDDRINYFTMMADLGIVQEIDQSFTESVSEAFNDVQAEMEQWVKEVTQQIQDTQEEIASLESQLAEASTELKHKEGADEE